MDRAVDRRHEGPAPAGCGVGEGCRVEQVFVDGGVHRSEGELRTAREAHHLRRRYGAGEHGDDGAQAPGAAWQQVPTTQGPRRAEAEDDEGHELYAEQTLPEVVAELSVSGQLESTQEGHRGEPP